jgi:hypothetical protein
MRADDGKRLGTVFEVRLQSNCVRWVLPVGDETHNRIRLGKETGEGGRGTGRRRRGEVFVWRRNGWRREG